MSREKQLEHALRGLIEIATGALEHDRAGQCPDAVEGHDARDADCAACKAVMRAERLLSEPAQAEQSEQQPVAWMHDEPGRVDVIHASVRKLLRDSHEAAGFLHRPLDKSERYTIPLYAAPIAPAPQRDALVDLLRVLERTHAGHMVGHDQSDQPRGGYSDGYVKGFGACIEVVKKRCSTLPQGGE